MTVPTLKALQFLSDDLRGWARVWAVIAKRYGDPACRHPVVGEVWQYMGTTSKGWHEFRHRALPTALVEVAERRHRDGFGTVVRSGDCGGWRVYDRVRLEASDFDTADIVEAAP